MSTFNLLPNCLPETGDRIKSVKTYSQKEIVNKMRLAHTVLGSGFEKDTGSHVDEVVKGGVCRAFSTKWIVSAFNTGSSTQFWHWLDSDEAPKTLGQLGHKEHEAGLLIETLTKLTGNPKTAPIILNNEMLFKEKFKGMEKQLKLNPDGLWKAFRKAIEDKKEWASELIKKDTQKALRRDGETRKFDDPYDFAEAATGQEGFALLYMNNDTGKDGHCMALHCDGTNVRFMDPNHGEVSFSDKHEFRTWFAFAHLMDMTKFEIEVFPCTGTLDPPTKPPVPKEKPWKKKAPKLPGSKPELKTVEQNVEAMKKLLSLAKEMKEEEES